MEPSGVLTETIGRMAHVLDEPVERVEVRFGTELVRTIGRDLPRFATLADWNGAPVCYPEEPGYMDNGVVVDVYTAKSRGRFVVDGFDLLCWQG